MAGLIGAGIGAAGTALSAGTVETTKKPTPTLGGGNLMAAHGGMVPPKKMADGGVVKQPASLFGKHHRGIDIGPIQLADGGDVEAPIDGEQLAAEREIVPGEAKVAGDSLQNDVVPAMLSPGECVIPRSIMEGPNAPAKAAKFVADILAKQRKQAK
jgi:hypothetical protein